MRVATLTAWNENMRSAEAGDHKGRPYDGFAGAYFRSNRSCRFSPTPPIMKMGVLSSESHHWWRGTKDGFLPSQE